MIERTHSTFGDEPERGAVKHQAQSKQVVVVAIAVTGPSGNLIVPQQEVEQNITVSDLPTADPHVKGQLWSNAGVITISAG